MVLLYICTQMYVQICTMYVQVCTNICTQKLYNMYISVSRWRSRSSRNYFLNVKTKAVASDSRKVNGAQCRQSRRRS